MSDLSHDDPEIVIVERPRIYQSDLGDMDEENAALYISYRMRRDITARTVRSWRSQGVGPKFGAGPGGRPIWYRETDIDRWIEQQCIHDPLAA